MRLGGILTVMVIVVIASLAGRPATADEERRTIDVDRLTSKAERLQAIIEQTAHRRPSYGGAKASFSTMTA